jgi:branched-chain amino acid transport system permease protein
VQILRNLPAKEAKDRQFSVTISSFWRIFRVFAVLILVLPLPFDSIVVVPVLIQVYVAIILSLSYNMVLGQTGLLSFVHAIYFGFGGFAAVHALRFAGSGELPVSVPFIPLFGAVMGLVMAATMASFTARRTGMAFAMITLCLVELVIASGSILGRFYGGGVDRTLPPAFFGQNFVSDLSVYYVTSVWMIICIAGMAFFARSPLGRLSNAVRDNAERVEFVSFDPWVVRFAAMSASGIFAGIAGSLFAIAYEFVGGETITFATSSNIIIMTYIGGIGHFAGPVIGAVLVTFLQTMLSNYTQIWGLYLGLLFVTIVLFLPHGLAGLISSHAAAVRSGTWRRLAKPYLHLALASLWAGAGLIGLLEMISYLNEAAADEPILILAGLHLDTSSVLPWFTLIVITLSGGWFYRRSLKTAQIAFQETL